MGKDGVPRLKLVVVADDGDTGPRLCRGCGGPLMPAAKATAVFCSSRCRSRHRRGTRRTRARTEAVEAGRTSSCPERRPVSGTRERLAAARARGNVDNRPTAVDERILNMPRHLLPKPEHSITAIARMLGVSA